jgi:hypothetical protein
LAFGVHRLAFIVQRLQLLHAFPHNTCFVMTSFGRDLIQNVWLFAKGFPVPSRQRLEPYVGLRR